MGEDWEDNDDEHFEPQDIKSFCTAFRDAWLLTPDLRFHETLSLVFNGYDLSELTPSELVTMMDEYLLQNQ